MKLKHLLTLLLSAFIASAQAETHEFTVATYNVDGLPRSMYGIKLNDDGPESEGTTKLSKKLLEADWDIVGLNEDFNFHKEIVSVLGDTYSFGTWKGELSLAAFLANGMRVPSDGLGLAYKKNIQADGETLVEWCEYSGYMDKDNDGLAEKGFRYYLMTMPWGLKMDLYVLHADAGVDQEDADVRVKQFDQLASYILKANTGRPKIIMGDYNCLYDRDELKSYFIDVLNDDDHLTAKDACIEVCNDDTYPVCTHTLDEDVAKRAEGEVLDHILYVNDDRSEWRLQALDYQHVMSFVDSDGETQLSDHEPICSTMKAMKGAVDGINNVTADDTNESNIRKVIINGKLVIVKNGIKYNVNGVEMR